MRAKWTERGIEDSHGHLIADTEGTVVCTKRKEREEIPVGEMVIERAEKNKRVSTELSFVAKSAVGKLLENDSWSMNLRISLEEANHELRRAVAKAGKHKEMLVQRIKEVVYNEGLAAPDIETLNSDKRFACPAHPDSRFLWEHLVPYQTNTTAKIFHYRRSCLQCSLPEHFRDVVSLSKVASSVQDAYSCTVCGIVFGAPRTETSGAYDHVKNYYCILCGNNIGHLVYDLGR